MRIFICQLWCHKGFTCPQPQSTISTNAAEHDIQNVNIGNGTENCFDEIEEKNVNLCVNVSTYNKTKTRIEPNCKLNILVLLFSDVLRFFFKYLD
jgi:hypothetical protein